MRITFNALHNDATAGLARSAQRLLDAQRQVSTGKRIDRPSDDPSAMALATVERSALATTEQYTRAADSVQSRLTVIDTVLSDVVSKLTAAQVEVMAARGTTKTESQREAAAQALLALRDAVLDDLNTSFRGTYVFAGAAGTTPPYQKGPGGTVGPYGGSTQEVEIDIDRGQAATVAFDGQVLAQGNETDDVFAVFEAAVAAARAGDEVGLGAAMQAFDRAFARATAMQSRVGASLRSVEDGRDRLTQMKIASQMRISSLEDANMAEAITNMSQADTAYRAALGAAAALTKPSLMDYLK